MAALWEAALTHDTWKLILPEEGSAGIPLAVQTDGFCWILADAELLQAAHFPPLALPSAALQPGHAHRCVHRDVRHDDAGDPASLRVHALENPCRRKFPRKLRPLSTVGRPHVRRLHQDPGSLPPQTSLPSRLRHLLESLTQWKSRLPRDSAAPANPVRLDWPVRRRSHPRRALPTP